MPTLSVEVSSEVAEALTRQARSLLLGRRAYVRAVLAAVAAQAALDRDRDRASGDGAAAHGERAMSQDRDAHPVQIAAWNRLWALLLRPPVTLHRAGGRQDNASATTTAGGAEEKCARDNRKEATGRGDGLIRPPRREQEPDQGAESPEMRAATDSSE